MVIDGVCGCCFHVLSTFYVVMVGGITVLGARVTFALIMLQ